MPQLPRLAVGTIQAEADTQALSWGLMGALSAAGLQVQHYLSRACFAPLDGASAMTGVPSRHLDTWLMNAKQCWEILAHGARSSDVCVVDGQFSAARGPDSEPGGRLELLCDWLDLPRLAIVDAARLSECRLPKLPEGTGGVLLDRVAENAERHELETKMESLWGVPILGRLGPMPGVRKALARLPSGSVPPAEICQELTSEFSARSSIGRIRELLVRRDLPCVAPELFRESRPTVLLRVAVAYDDAFRCYFPDVLEQLERRGAVVVDFSPLRDESLPADVDVVYLGCGHPERWAETLSNNHCMSLAIRKYLCGGGRIYAEGGGLAYLCQHLELPEGRRLPMVGAMPALARPNPTPKRPSAIELTLKRGNWLAPAGTRWRGYLNSNWLIEPVGDLRGYRDKAVHQRDLVGCYRAVGSRVHFHLGLEPDRLHRFFYPLAASEGPSRGATAVR